MRLANEIKIEAGSSLRVLLRTVAAILVLGAFCVSGLTACSSENADVSGSGGIVSSAENVTSGIGTPLVVGNAVITVKSFEAAFQPVAPAQRISDEALVAPAAGVTFYQAIVHIENRGQLPLRVDPEDFVCRIGNVLNMLEPTRSGPAARSIIYGTSLDLLLTFRGTAGAEPTLVYNPPWYGGLIIFGADVQSASTTTTILTTE